METTVQVRKHQPYTAGDVVFNIINYAFFGIFALSCIFPFYYIFINTISSTALVASGQITLWPREMTLSNYQLMTSVSAFWSSVWVTVSRTIIGTVLMVLASSLAGYVVTKNEMWGRKFWYRFIVITMYFNAGLIPWYLNIHMLGLTSTFAVYIIPMIVQPFNIILVKTYVESIPAEIEESAFMDGAGYWKIYRSIIWPLSKPILATIAIFGAVGHWNSLQDSLILNQNAPDLHTLQHRLYTYLTQSSNLEAELSTNPRAAGGMLNVKVIQYTISMVTVIPILCVYPF
ncbi:MAG: carbohydrate ABC transporter permease, partial [Oscillospiraceae bacterium]|nr:carbohydrate ABC transporter permease [Oscillospiraceae bacterium]